MTCINRLSPCTCVCPLLVKTEKPIANQLFKRVERWRFQNHTLNTMNITNEHILWYNYVEMWVMWSVIKLPLLTASHISASVFVGPSWERLNPEQTTTISAVWVVYLAVVWLVAVPFVALMSNHGAIHPWFHQLIKITELFHPVMTLILTRLCLHHQVLWTQGMFRILMQGACHHLVMALGIHLDQGLCLHPVGLGIHQNRGLCHRRPTNPCFHLEIVQCLQDFSDKINSIYSHFFLLFISLCIFMSFQMSL